MCVDGGMRQGSFINRLREAPVEQIAECMVLAI